jgi:hypothetical protein
MEAYSTMLMPAVGRLSCGQSASPIYCITGKMTFFSRTESHAYGSNFKDPSSAVSNSVDVLSICGIYSNQYSHGVRLNNFSQLKYLLKLIFCFPSLILTSRYENVHLKAKR